MRTVWIIDGAYVFSHNKTLIGDIDYLKLKTELESINQNSINDSYYLNSSQNPSADSQDKFHTWLKSAPPKGPKLRVKLYSLKNMRVKCQSCACEFEKQVQKGVDVGIATLIVKLAAQNRYDRLILTAGDGDFEDAISYIKEELHKEFWLNGAKGCLSSDLQSYADNVIWFDDIESKIIR
ncbi:MAG: hypothetical protein RL154_1518 [Pseudomonadota bacterium]|jgi:uncharacterized LabA/DUF88 family protein